MIISILGCGWFGLPFGQRLVSEGYTVKGSTTSPGKLKMIGDAGIEPYLISLQPGLNFEEDDPFFACDLLLVTMPPRARSTPEHDYIGCIETLLTYVRTRRIPRLLFISSTSVLGDRNQRVDESTAPQPETPNGKLLQRAEHLVMTGPVYRATVVRFGGLVGPGRDPGNFFAGKTDIPNGRAPVNLIHLDDCIGICLAIIRREAYGYIIHACAPDHPMKQEFYTQATRKLGKEKPSFVDELKTWKIVDSVHADALLTYSFRVANWMSWVSS